MSDAVFLTGGTGFLGSALIARLLESDEGPDVFVAVRARDEHDAAERVRELLARLYERPPPSARRVRGVRAEMTEPNLGLSRRDRREVTRNVRRIVHCAASISFSLRLEEARAVNVDGTKHVLELARAIPELERLVHVSTAYVAGRARGLCRERPVGTAAFRNTYEQTKHESEVALGAAAAAGALPAVVVRPSIVVGESDSGWTSAFNVIYWPLQAFARGLLDTVPADPAGVVDIVPVDYVTDVIERATFVPEARGIFQAVSGDRALTVAELVAQASALLGRRPPALTAPGALPAEHPASVFAPYFDVQTRFDDARTRRLRAATAGPPPLEDYLSTLIEYGERARWGRKPVSREVARRDAAAMRAA